MTPGSEANQSVAETAMNAGDRFVFTMAVGWRQDRPFLFPDALVVSIYSSLRGELVVRSTFARAALDIRPGEFVEVTVAFVVPDAAAFIGEGIVFTLATQGSVSTAQLAVDNVQGRLAGPHRAAHAAVRDSLTGGRGLSAMPFLLV